jgi:catechol 2,3-dioxygenase-like lactoylglutathione lyase family enzyme
MIRGLHHVQLSMPPGEDAVARAFYGDVLGLPEILKPANLARRGGVWFRLGGQELHVGVESAFRPAQRAHPAILVSELDSWRARLERHGHTPHEDEPLPGFRRFYVADPFGNRLELLEPEA